MASYNWPALAATGAYGTGEAERPFLLSSAAKRKLQQHDKDFRLTSDFGRPYSNLLSKQGRFVVENWVRWTEVFSSYLLCPLVHGSNEQLLPPLAKKAWGHLRRFIMHHQRIQVDPADPLGPNSSYHADRRQDARTELLEYAKIMDEVSSWSVRRL
jgi:hypothetical protein